VARVAGLCTLLLLLQLTLRPPLVSRLLLVSIARRLPANTMKRHSISSQTQRAFPIRAETEEKHSAGCRRASPGQSLVSTGSEIAGGPRLAIGHDSRNSSACGGLRLALGPLQTSVGLGGARVEAMRARPSDKSRFRTGIVRHVHWVRCMCDKGVHRTWQMAGDGAGFCKIQAGLLELRLIPMSKTACSRFKDAQRRGLVQNRCASRRNQPQLSARRSTPLSSGGDPVQTSVSGQDPSTWDGPKSRKNARSCRSTATLCMIAHLWEKVKVPVILPRSTGPRQHGTPGDSLYLFFMRTSIQPECDPFLAPAVLSSSRLAGSPLVSKMIAIHDGASLCPVARVRRWHRPTHSLHWNPNPA
jgi:hypothetical protein